MGYILCVYLNESEVVKSLKVSTKKNKKKKKKNSYPNQLFLFIRGGGSQKYSYCYRQNVRKVFSAICVLIVMHISVWNKLNIIM